MGRIVGALAVLVWIAHLLKNQSARRKLHHSKLLRVALLYIIPVMLSATIWLFEQDGERALNQGLTLFLMFVLTVMVENVITRGASIRMLAMIIAVSNAIICIPAILIYFGIDIYSLVGVEAPTEASIESSRAFTLSGNANALGISARNGIFGSILFLTFLREKPNKALAWVALLICFLGLTLSGSRTNFFGSMILIGFIFSFGIFRDFFRKSKILFITIGLLTITYGAFEFAPEAIRQRLLMGAAGDSQYATDMAYRRYETTTHQQLQAWHFFQKYPLLGIGPDRTQFESGGKLGAHDTLSVLIGETGLLGTIGFLILLIWSTKTLWKLLRSSKALENKLRYSLLLGMISSMVIMGIFGGFIIPDDRTFWVSLGLIYPIYKTARLNKKIAWVKSGKEALYMRNKSSFS